MRWGVVLERQRWGQAQRLGGYGVRTAGVCADKSRMFV